VHAVRIKFYMFVFVCVISVFVLFMSGVLFTCAVRIKQKTNPNQKRSPFLPESAPDKYIDMKQHTAR
jgi:hypothetical protein